MQDTLAPGQARRPPAIIVEGEQMKHLSGKQNGHGYGAGKAVASGCGRRGAINGLLGRQLTGLLALVVLAGVGPSLAAQPASSGTPASQVAPGDEMAQAEAVIRRTADVVLKELEANREAYEKDPEALRAMIRRVVVPNLDMDLIARRVLGKQWRNASQAQRKAFQEAFTTLLLRTYATAVKDYRGEQLHYLPAKQSASGRTIVVPTRLTRPDGSEVAIDYALADRGQGWKVYDVKVEDISLVLTYRSEYASVVEREGIDGLIALLQEKNRTAEAGEVAAPAGSNVG